MAVKNLSTRVAIIGRGAKCRGGSSAVDRSAYISRTTMYSEYDGTTYYPKYSEDLAHNEVMLPVNAPAEYLDPSVLWNSVEMKESKSAKAQLARSYKISLPNEWSYELAIEVMRDYVKRNFVDDGMCAQFAIHDSENPNTHQRNLHCHIMLTMRPILEDGSWGDKQKKIYVLDADGNKIRKKNGQYKCTTQDVTGWNSRENAKKWRKDLADTINAVNDKNGLRENFWEHRSFAEQGLDIIPQIHLGEKATALEKAGIQSERGNINRRIMEQNKAILTAKMLVAKAEEQLQKLVNSKPVEAVRNTANEVLDMIRAVVSKKGRLELPIVKSKYVRKISQRQALQEQDRMERFVVANQIESFEQLQEFKTQREPDYEKLSAERQQIAEQIARLEQLLVAYSEYEPYIVYHKTSNSLKGFAKRKYDREHERELRDYDSYRAELKKMLSSDEKITPKKWTEEKAKLEERLQESNPDYARVVTELASTEVIEHKKEAGTALVEMCKEMKSVNTPTVIGEYAGFKMAVSFDSFNHKFVMNVKGQLSHNLEIGSDPLGNITRINNALESMPRQLEEAQTKLATVEHQLETAKVEVTKPFAQEAELAEKLDRLSALNALLNMDEKGDNAIGMDDDTPDVKIADKPGARVSLKERLAEMKVKVAGNQMEKPVVKEKGKEETL